MNDTWESDIASLLNQLAGVQGELLELLSEKRQVLAKGDEEALAAIGVREQSLIERLQACQEKRQQLLSDASEEGLPADSILSLSEAIPTTDRGKLRENIKQASSRSRLLQHQSLTNWVLVQRSLLHLSQLIEIIATGGRMQPTYGSGASPSRGGSLVDQEV